MELPENYYGNIDYPSPADVKLYINGIWIDDAYRIDYTDSNPRTPLYDYTSRYYKDIAEGHVIVQGQLVINFRFKHYLFAVLADRALRVGKQPNIIKDISNADTIEYYAMMSKGTPKEKIQTLLHLKAVGGLAPAKQVAYDIHGGGSVDPIRKTSAITEMKVPSFDIEITYNGDESQDRSVIKDCYLTSESQVISAAAIAGGDLSASSMPIFEIYSFFGKRIEYYSTKNSLRS